MKTAQAIRESLLNHIRKVQSESPHGLSLFRSLPQYAQMVETSLIFRFQGTHYGPRDADFAIEANVESVSDTIIEHFLAGDLPAVASQDVFDSLVDFLNKYRD